MTDGNWIVLCADDAYAAQLAVTLYSIEEHLEQGARFRAMVLTPDMGEVNRERIAAGLAQLELVWREVATDEFDDFALKDAPVVTYYRMLLDRYLPADCERVLYLDCDVLVRDNIAPLFSERLEGKLLAACQDMHAIRIGSPTGLTTWRELELDPQAPYLNAGVLMIDMQRWRALDFGTRLRSYMQEWGHLNVYWDQDAVNACAHGCWRRLPLKWNYTPAVAVENSWAALLMDGEDLKSASSAPAIVHFAGRKPWGFQGQRGEWAPAWRAVLDGTGFQVKTERMPWWIGVLLASWRWLRPLTGRYRT